MVIISVYLWLLRHPCISGINSTWLWYVVVFVRLLSCVRYTRLLCPPPSPRVCSDSCPLSQWWYLILCLHLLLLPSIFPSIRDFPRSWLFASRAQSIGAESVPPINTHGLLPLWLTLLTSLQSKGFSRVFFSTTVWEHQFFIVQPSLWSNSHIHTLLEKP